MWNKLYNSLLNKRNEIYGFLNPLISNRGLRIILTGAGTSAFVGYSTAGYLRRTLGINVETIDSTDIVSAPKDYLFKGIETLVISHARSGDSPESAAIIDLAEKFIDKVYL